jgi:hypothetical protein
MAEKEAVGSNLEKRNDAKILELQKKKFQARNKLRALRAEMRRLDVDLIGAGANGLELNLACW